MILLFVSRRFALGRRALVLRYWSHLDQLTDLDAPRLEWRRRGLMLTWCSRVVLLEVE